VRNGRDQLPRRRERQRRFPAGPRRHNLIFGPAPPHARI